MKRIASLLLGIMVCAGLANADVKLPVTAEVSAPLEYGEGVYITIADSLQNWPPQEYEKNGRPWVVYSDRADNVTYEEPSYKSKRYSKLDFGQKVRIVAIKGSWALVYTDNDSVKFPFIGWDTAVTYGWIPTEHLILWNRCPINQNGKSRVALPNGCVESDSLQYYYVYNKPQGGSSKHHVIEKTYYVMKIDGQRALLISNDTIDKNKNRIIGWVDISQLIIVDKWVDYKN